MKRLLILGLLLTGCVTGEDEAAATVRKSGFTNVHTGDTQIYGCGENDKMGRKFRATNAQGQEVEGLVCCGTWKGCTIRF